jgi:hypothetical protein
VLNKARKRLLEVKLGKGTLNFKSQGEIWSEETHNLRVGMSVKCNVDAEVEPAYRLKWCVFKCMEFLVS